MKKMAQLLTAYKASKPDEEYGLAYVAANVNLMNYVRDLLERLMLGTETDKLQGLSDTEVNSEVTTYLLWKSLNG